MRKRKQAATKEALLDAAEMLFAKDGYTAVSTREIAKAADVNLGAIDYYFSSKSQLFIEVIRRMLLRRKAEEAVSALDGEITTREHAAEQLCRCAV